MVAIGGQPLRQSLVALSRISEPALTIKLGDDAGLFGRSL